MWLFYADRFGGSAKFFRVSVGYDNLRNFFETNFAMMQHHKYNLNDIENMLPWEKQVYVGLLINYIQEENERIKLQNAGKKRR
jgi:hypothetical protein